MEQLRVSIVPAGEFGASLAIPASKNVKSVLLYDRSAFRACEFNTTRIHHRHQNVIFPDNVRATPDLKEAVQSADIVIFAARSREAYEQYQEVSEAENEHAKPLLLSVVKGLYGNKLLSEMLEEINPGVSSRLSVLSGPNFASDIAKRNVVKTVVASVNKSRDIQQEALTTEKFEVYLSKDVVGVQLGGALKNPYAILAGILEAKGKWDGLKREFKKRSISEMADLGFAMGASRDTFKGISGRGDLNITCTPKSRNFRAGIDLGRGVSPEELFNSGKTIEGLYAIQGAMALAEIHGIRLPFMEILWSILNDSLTVTEAVDIIERYINLYSSEREVVSLARSLT